MRSSRRIPVTLAVVLMLHFFFYPRAAETQLQPLRGFADIHNHQFANLAFGGKVIVGHAYGPIEDTLSSARDEQNHGKDHLGDIVGAFLAARGPAVRFYSNQGYPAFAGWPDVEEVTHQKVHEDWLLRAVQGGLRLMVMFAVDGPPLCTKVATDGRDCSDETATIERQIDAAYAMQSYIDQKAGGPGKGWYRVVLTPTEARQAIRGGKLAVVLGVETAHLFNCHNTGPCDWEEQLRRHWSRGVRHFFPVHQDDNAFAGASYFNPVIQRQRGSVVSDVQSVITPYELTTYPCPQYDRGQCNSRGLTERGLKLIDEMMRLGAIIDIDHMSDKAASQTLDRAEQRRYPGVVASHAGFNEINNGSQDHEGQLTPTDLRRIQKLGGMIGLITGQGDLHEVDTWTRAGRHYVTHACGRTSETFAQAYLYALDRAPGMPIALGTDFGGPLSQPGPRFGPRECLGGLAQGIRSGGMLTYPFVARGSGVRLPRQNSGSRTFDFNYDGLAHVGMLPDFIADLEVLGVTDWELEPLFNSAEGYVHMWERASRARSSSDELIATILSLFDIE